MVKSAPRRVFLWVLLTAVTLTALTLACGRTGGSEPTTLRLGYFPNLSHATALVGIESGLFAKHLPPGLTLQTFTFNAGPAAIEALFAGGIDATFVGPNPALNGYIRSRGEALRVIAGATSAGASLVVRPDIQSVAGLRGKKIATPQLGNTQDVALRHWLKTQGLATTTTGTGDVSIMPQENAQTLDTFRSGQIDGAWVPEPWATRIVLEGGARILVEERDLWPGGQFVTTHLVARTEFLRDHPAAIEGLLRGHVEATKTLVDKPAESQQAANQALTKLTGRGLPPEVVSTAWTRLAFTVDPLAASLRQSASNAAELGLLDMGGMSLDGLYDLTLLNKVLQGNGQPEVRS
jgi:NitT/TauT family transport system substrate-binding protein